jgi:hypothetical protein
MRPTVPRVPPLVRLVMAAAAVCAITPSSVLGAGQGPTVGYVFEVRRVWESAGGKLEVGTGVRNGDKIALKEQASAVDAVIKIGFIDGTVQVRECSKIPPGECQKAIEINIPTSQTLSARLTAVWARLASTKAPPVFAISRGAADDQVAEESVLPLTGGVPDLAPALTSVAKGDLKVFLSPAGATRTGSGPQAQGTESSGIQLAARWDPPKLAVTGPQVAAGAYFLRLADDDATPVMVLIAPANDAGRLAADFDEAKKLSRSWPREMGNARHTFLSLVLLGLGGDAPAGR